MGCVGGGRTAPLDSWLSDVHVLFLRHISLPTDGVAAEPGAEVGARDPQVEDTWGQNRRLLYSTDAGKFPWATVVACQSAW